MTTPIFRSQHAGLRRGGVSIVPDLTLEIPAGCLFGLVGPGGSGKTTIMRAMMGLGAIHTGEMTLLGQPAGHKSLRQRIGYLPQNGGVWPDLTARECLNFIASMYRTAPDRIESALDLLELSPIANRPVATLSGGEVRRVGLAMAVLHDPPVLILDEPTVGLDPRLRRKLWNTFATWTETGTTLVVSTHVMDEARLCDRIAVISEGRVVALDSPVELVRQQTAIDLEEAILRLLEREVGNGS